MKIVLEKVQQDGQEGWSINTLGKSGEPTPSPAEIGLVLLSLANNIFVQAHAAPKSVLELPSRLV